MYFNLSRYVCRFMFTTIMGCIRLASYLALLPLRVAFSGLGLIGAGVAFATIKPAHHMIKKTFYKPAPVKRYMKIGKPAVAPLAVSAVSRPSMGDVAPMMYAYKTVVHSDARVDHVKRAITQKQLFMAKFADVVQVGI